MARGTNFSVPIDIGAPFQTYHHSYIYIHMFINMCKKKKKKNIYILTYIMYLCMFVYDVTCKSLNFVSISSSLVIFAKFSKKGRLRKLLNLVGI